MKLLKIKSKYVWWILIVTTNLLSISGTLHCQRTISIFNQTKLPTLPNVTDFRFSPDSSKIALLMHANNGVFLTGDEYYLAIAMHGDTSILTKDLLLGFGKYEGEIVDLRWKNNAIIEIARIVNDLDDTVIFNVETWSWIKNIHEKSIDELIFDIAEMPYISQYSGDAEFWHIVKQSRHFIDTLIEYIDDNRETEAVVPNFGGKYTVGDIAVLAIWRIIADMPLVNMVCDTSKEDYKRIGFGVYWNYVRENRNNRVELKNRIRNWYHSSKNVDWIKIENHPAGGFYCMDETGEYCKRQIRAAAGER